MNRPVVEDHNAAPEKKSRPFVYIILAALCALLLWLYVSGVDTDIAEKKFTAVSISLENSDIMRDRYGFSVLSGYNLTADITVSGKKSDINKLKATDLAASVDLEQIASAGENKLEVNTAVPDGMSVTSCYPQSITVYVDETTTKAVPVTVHIVSMTKGGDIELSEPQLSHQAINVSGPLKLLESIEKAVVSLDLGNITSSFDITGSAVLTDAQGEAVNSPYLRADASEVTVSYSVYKTKQIPLVVGFKNGFISTGDYSVNISPSSLKVKGEPGVIDGLESITVKTFDEAQLTEKVTDALLSAESIVLPDGVTLDDAAALGGGVTVDLRLLNSEREISIPFNSANISVVGASGLEHSFNQELMTVHFRGDASRLSLLTEQDIKLSVDLSSFNTEGIKTNVKVNVEYGGERGCYVVGEYYTSVTLTAAPQP